MYILLTFYNRQTAQDPAWEVYGHIRPGENRLLQIFRLRSQAIEFAHSLGSIPVLEGTNKGHIVERLCLDCRREMEGEGV